MTRDNIFVEVKDISKLNRKDRNMYNSVQVIKKLSTGVVASYLMHAAIDMISKESNVEFLHQMKWFSLFGKGLMDKYVYLLCRDYNAKNNENLTLSQWKNNNIDHWEYFYKSGVYIPVGGIL